MELSAQALLLDPPELEHAVCISCLLHDADHAYVGLLQGGSTLVHSLALQAKSDKQEMQGIRLDPPRGSVTARRADGVVCPLNKHWVARSRSPMLGQ